MSTTTWKDHLSSAIPEQIKDNIEKFESQIQLKKQSKVEDKVFAETRLRLGLYGQRYDNGFRYDGSETREIAFPGHNLTKGPDTKWDAPGMVRIKLPKGDVNPEQIDLIADLSEEYSDCVNHITTRQDIQLHYIHVEDTPDLMYRLGAVGITTQDACGNSVRNITTHPSSGIHKDEVFNVDPYADILFKFLLGHPDTIEFGRKFKIALSGFEHEACALTNMHDMGLIAKEELIDGKKTKGFKFLIGGGLGAVPHDAATLYEFLTPEKLLPVTQAVCRIFSRLGEKQNRALARIKFLVAKQGIENFRNLVEEELKIMPVDPRCESLLSELKEYCDEPKNKGGEIDNSGDDVNYSAWLEKNVDSQKQDGYHLVTISVPLGDLSPEQMRSIGNISRTLSSDSIRFSIEQNVILRWVSGTDLKKVYLELVKVGLADAEAGTISDITACPGTDTCKLGTSSSRGLAYALRKHFESNPKLKSTIEDLKIKISGCYNSCGQHHLSDLGFYGVNRKKDGKDVPHFQVVLGGRWSEKIGSYGLPIAAIPSKNVPSMIESISEKYLQEKENDESFPDYINRIGKKATREVIQPFMKIPEFEDKPDFYFDWGDTRQYTTGDKGVGECAGEIVSLFDFDINASERVYFEGQIALDDNDFKLAQDKAIDSMRLAALGLVKVQDKDAVGDKAKVVEEFKKRYVDTSIYVEKFAQYFFDANSEGENTIETARRSLQEAHLFIEEVIRCRDEAANATSKK
jgi:sulfite reductase (ferredoxin)